MSEKNHCDSLQEKIVNAASKDPNNIKLLVKTLCACAIIATLCIAPFFGYALYKFGVSYAIEKLQ